MYVLPIGGLYKYRKSGENHQFQGNLIHTLQHSVSTNSYEVFKKYTDGMNSLPPTNLRDLLEFKKANNQININEVEPIGVLPRDLEVVACHTELYQRRHTKLWQLE